MEYITVICDLKGSKRLKDRDAIQHRLIQALRETNGRFGRILAAPFIITVGDEWQGLLVYPCDYRMVLDFFHERLEGLDFYTGLGVGEVTVHDRELTVNQLDGPAFHKARAAVNLAKRKNFSLVYIH
ncbi:MAG: SatD family protein [Bacteroidota bacterium]